MSNIAITFSLIILYVYFGYLGLVLLLGMLRNRKVLIGNHLPKVALMIAAYNEEKDIRAKILNSLELDYPKDLIDIVVVSDGSDDKTDEIVRSFGEQATLIRVEGRVGKTEARNIALKQIDSEIVVFSDATTMYNTDAIKKLVRNFADAEVGMVTGQLKYRDPGNSQMSLGQKLYWKYESLIKDAQTKMGTLTGSVGCITAFRRELYKDLPANVIEDFTQPLMIIAQGKRVVFEKEAVCFEYATQSSNDEWNMRVRVVRGGLCGLIYARKVLNPLRYPVASFQLISHKLLRWLVPVFTLIVLVSSVAAVIFEENAVIAQSLVGLQGFYILMVLMAFVQEHFGIRGRLTALFHYLFIVNAASLTAAYKTLTEPLDPTWEPNREATV
ncbi:MAG: glycosyltransferase family 2 protein [Bacteriovoracaceae bacterium]|nr:glycosyltransferase family 2 protein [Bacteriovoracaceae bacterium]